MDYVPEPAVIAGRDITAHDDTTHTLMALVEAVDQRDGHTAGHSKRLARQTLALGMALGVDNEDLRVLYRGGCLHDIGKIGIPDAILLKPGRLTMSEWATMRSHTVRGESICRHLESLKPILPLIRNHHEKFDGTGYPDGLRGEQIPLLARIVQVADIFDALTSPRPYKPAFSSEKALRILQEETDLGWRDPHIVKTFFRLHQAGPLPMRESLANLRDSIRIA